MVDQTVSRQILPNMPKLKLSPRVAHDRKVLIYTPELLKAISARITYLHRRPGEIAAELGMDKSQVLRAIGLGRKLLIKDTWATFKPTLTYDVVHDAPREAKTRAYVRKSPVAQDKWPLTLIKWVIAQHEHNGHSGTAIYRALPPEDFTALPTQATIHLWVKRAFKYLEDLEVTKADCLLYAYDPSAAQTHRGPAKKPSNKPTVKRQGPKRVSKKAKVWAREKILELLKQHCISFDELGE